MGRSRYIVHTPDAPHFCTCTVVGWVPLLARHEAARIVLNSLQFLQEEKRLTLGAYVVMPDHLHLIARADDLAREIACFKSYTARRLIDELEATGRRHMLRRLARLKRWHKRDRQYQVWQEGSSRRFRDAPCSNRSADTSTTIRFSKDTWTIRSTGATQARVPTPVNQG